MTAPQASAADLPKRTNTKNGSSELPANSSYIGTRKTYLDVNASSITVSPTLGYQYRTEIPFCQLAAVIFLRPAAYGRKKRDGVLLFRGEANQHIPVPDVRGMFSDQSAVIVPPEKATVFYHVYQMLRVVAPSGARFEMIRPEVSGIIPKASARDIDLEYFWNMYAPYRERAVSGICAKYEIEKEEADWLVERAFDERQEILYAADPLDAVRDLNLVVSNMSRETERKNRQEAQSRKLREQDAVKKSLEHIELMMMLDKFHDK